MVFITNNKIVTLLIQSLPIWQFWPLYPLAQLHVYVVGLLADRTQAPPFRHGFCKHGSDNEIHIISQVTAKPRKYMSFTQNSFNYLYFEAVGYCKHCK